MRVWKTAVSFGLAVFVLLGALIPAKMAAAQTVPNQGLSLQISPLPIELTAKPGTSTSTDLRVRNAGSQTEKLQVKLLKVTEDDNGIVHLTQPGPADEWAKWVSFSKTVFDAPSNQWQDIVMTINVPKSAAFGYYFAVEYLRAADQKPQAGQAVAHGAVATFILLNADAPGAKREARIVSFTADRKSYEFLPATFTVKIHAGGNVHVAASGNIFIKKGGKQIAAIDINSAGGNVLPQSSRFFSASWSDGFPVYETKYVDGKPAPGKNGQTATTLKWNLAHANRLRFGKYTANLVMVYDNGQLDVPLQASVSFWVIPWRLLAGLLVILALVGLGLWSIFRKTFRLAKKTRRKKPEKSS